LLRPSKKVALPAPVEVSRASRQRIFYGWPGALWS